MEIRDNIIFKVFLLLLFIFTITGSITSQNLGECGFTDIVEPPSDPVLACDYASEAWMNKYRTPGYWIPDEDTPIKTILVNYIICLKDNGTGGWVDSPEFRAEVDDMFDAVNLWYSNSLPKGYTLTCEPTINHVTDTRIRFELNEIIFINNTSFHYATNPSQIFDYLEVNHPNYKKAMNHFFTMPTNNTYWGRYDNNFTYDQSYVITFGSMWGPVVWDDHIHHIAHEYGHAVGLHHTYNGEYREISHYDFLDDIFGLCAEPNFCNPMPPPEYVCYLTSAFFTPQPLYYPLMSGDPNSRYISPKYAGRMHRALSFFNYTFKVYNRPMHKYVKEDLSFEVPLTITQDENWDFAIKMYQDIVIQQGNILTIGCEVRMPSGGSIIVEQGAKLIIDGGKITSAHSTLWKGIQVWGDADAHQYTIDGECAQGQVILKNGAVIENAAFGVLLGKHDTNSDSYDDDYAGGIIMVEGNYNTEEYSASFINCFIGVAFRPYQNHLPPPQSSWPTGNLSYFTNTHFEVNEECYILWWNTPMVDLMGVNGIHFNGCSFLNNQILNQNNLGYGIYASGSGFVVNDYCTILNPTSTGCEPEDIVHSSFTNFCVGATVSGSGSNTVGIFDADFYDNAYGIQLYNINNASIISNNFHIGETSGEEQEQCGDRASGYGIWMDNCSGFAIEENYFTKAAGAPMGFYTGIRVAETNAIDEIYRNEFENLSYPIYAEGKNWELNTFEYGLSLLCNQFTGSYRDIVVEKNDIHGGIQSSQGSASRPAGNDFVNNTGDYKIYNNGNYPVLYYYDAGSGTANPNPSYQVSRIPTGNSNNCPSHYGHPAIESVDLTDDEKLAVEQEYLTALYNYNNVKILYDNLQDGGDTEGLKVEVETAWPNDTWELRAELLGKSPHLSTEVLKKAADKTEVLPESILFEILSANPDELRKEELIKYLEDKENPLPQYMIDILRQVAYGTTYKTALQNQMAESNRLKTRAANDMIRSILNDSISDLDELRNWLDNLGGVKADQQIIESYLAEGNVDDALALVEMIPQLYQLSNYDLDEHAYYTEMLDLRLDLLQQGRNYDELTAGEITQLENLAQNSHGTAGAQARAILVQGYDHHFCDCLNISGNQGFKSTTINPALLNQALGVSLSVEPNPAKDWAAFDYTLPETEGKGVIKISDVTGKVIKTVEVTGTQGQYVWDTRQVKPGVYFYTFVVNGTGTTSKLVITK